MDSNPYVPMSAWDHFGYGFDSGRGPQSDSLAESSARWNELAQTAGTSIHSTLQQRTLSPLAQNLSAPSQRDRLLPNGYVLPNFGNGSASSTAQTEGYFKNDVV